MTRSSTSSSSISASRCNPSARGLARGVPMNVHQRLLKDSAQRHLGVAQQSPEAVGQLEIDADAAALCKPCGLPAQRRQQILLVKKWLMQQVGQRPDVGHRLLGERHHFGEVATLSATETLGRSGQSGEKPLQSGRFWAIVFWSLSRGDSSTLVVVRASVGPSVCYLSVHVVQLAFRRFANRDFFVHHAAPGSGSFVSRIGTADVCMILRTPSNTSISMTSFRVVARWRRCGPDGHSSGAISCRSNATIPCFSHTDCVRSAGLLKSV